MEESGLESNPEIDAVLVGLIGQVGASTSGLGSGRGAAWSARRLKTETAHQIVAFDPPQMDRVVAAIAQALNAEPQPGPGAHQVCFRGVVGAGFGKMNPAYVLVVVGPEQGRIGVAAYAKEGLIKQHTARKAVATVVEVITEAGGE